MWSLYENNELLPPLVFSNGKSQEDIVNEVKDAVKEGYKLIFIRGVCGTGKSAIALNLAKDFGKTSIVVPIKSLQEQYIQDYTQKKHVLKKDGKTKLKISSILGRKNFKCKFLDERPIQIRSQETNSKLTDIFAGTKPNQDNDTSSDNKLIPCKIEIKEKNIEIIKEYIRENDNVKISNFSSINEVKRMSVAPVCPYWSPILPQEYEVKRFQDANKKKYSGLNGIEFSIYQRKPGCDYYEQYESYVDSDVIIFNSLKYKLETLMNRKPKTELEIIDECDEFLDSFTNQERISLNRLSFALGSTFPETTEIKKILDELTDNLNVIKRIYTDNVDVEEINDTAIGDLIKTILANKNALEEMEIEESNYLFHLIEVAKIFQDFLDETFFSIEKIDNDIIISIVTTNLERRFNELVEKNKILVMMSGTLHSEDVLKNIFGLDKFKIIDAEVSAQGELIKQKKGYEVNCAYANFQSKKITRESFLRRFSASVDSSIKPTLVHLTSFYDLPNESEKEKFQIKNLPTQNELITSQKNDPFGKRIEEFKNKHIDVLFTTKCNRGIDFPGDICNSIIISRFPYPNISSIFWKILRKTNPKHFNSFYLDKANRELLQKIYRGLRSKNDKVQLFSPDIRVLNFQI